MTHGNVKGQWVKNETGTNIKAQIAKLEQQVKYCQDKIKWYEEELECRKQDVPLGIPAERRAYVDGCFLNCCGEAINQPLDPNDKYDQPMFNMLAVFTSEASALKHVEMLLDWRKALVANSKGEPIDIQVLLPLMKKGWVAMDKNGDWHWYAKKPKQGSDEWIATGFITSFHAFNIKPADDWQNSLMECRL